MSDLPTGWAWSTLGEVADVIAGPAFKSKEFVDSDQGVALLRGDNIEPGRLRWRRARAWPYKKLEGLDHLYVREGDVILAMDRPVVSAGLKLARVTPADTPALLVQRVARIRACNDFLPGYAYAVLQQGAFVGHLLGGQTGTQIPHVNLASIRRYRVPVPPLNEQRRIVAAIEEHLSRLDAAEDAVASAERRLDALRRATTGDLFSSNSWEWTTLGEIAQVKGGVTRDAKRERDEDLVEVPYLRVANVQRGYLDLKEVKTIRVPAARAAALRLRAGDILFNEGGDRDKLGRGWVWDDQIEGCVHQNHVFRARLLTDQFDPRFVSTHGNTWGRTWFEKNGKQTTNLASLNLTTLKQFPIPAPPIAEQRAIAAELGRLDEHFDRMRAANSGLHAQATALRRSILAAAFAGRLVPQDPTDEPASKLLERIATERAAAKPPRRRKAAS